MGYLADLSLTLSFLSFSSSLSFFFCSICRGKGGLSCGFIFLEDEWYCSICKVKGGLSWAFIFFGFRFIFLDLDLSLWRRNDTAVFAGGVQIDRFGFVFSFWRISCTAVFAGGGLSFEFIFLDKWHCSICKRNSGLSSRFIFLSFLQHLQA